MSTGLDEGIEAFVAWYKDFYKVWEYIVNPEAFEFTPQAANQRTLYTLRLPHKAHDASRGR